MSIEKLGEIYQNIDNYEKLCISLDGKIGRVESEKTEEEAVQHLMNFELTKITKHLEILRKEVGKLELEHKRSMDNQHKSEQLYNEFARGQKSLGMLREIEDYSKNKRNRALRKMGLAPDNKDAYGY